MKPKPKHIPKKAGAVVPKGMYTLPCPNCDAVCHAMVINLHTQHKDITPAGDVLVYPKGYVALRCLQCNLELLLGLDEDGKPDQELEEMREIFHQLDEIDKGVDEKN